MLKHIGGGTLMKRVRGSQRAEPDGRFPSDDDFEGTNPGSTVVWLYTVRCTVDRHFAMPDTVARIQEVLALPGVSVHYTRRRVVKGAYGPTITSEYKGVKKKAPVAPPWHEASLRKHKRIRRKAR